MASLGDVRAVGLRHHDLGDEVADGGGGLLGLELCQHEALVLRPTRALPSHEPEHAQRGQGFAGVAGVVPVALFGVEAAVGDAGDGEVLAEEQPPLAIGECDAGGGYLEVDRRGPDAGCQCCRDRPADGLWSREALRVQGVQVQHCTRRAAFEERPVVIGGGGGRGG